MKKTFLFTTIICGMMAAGTAYSGYGTQSLLFTPSGTIFNQNGTFTVDTTLTFTGYQSLGLSYWLETAPRTQSFFSITAETYFTFPDGVPGWPNNFDFMMTQGVDTGYFATHNDLGAAVHDVNMPVPPGTCQVSHIKFSITGAAPGVYTFFTTTTTPRPSIVDDTGFHDRPLPQASFSITIVPEPRTVVLLVLAGAALGMIAYRRCVTSR